MNRREYIVFFPIYTTKLTYGRIKGYPTAQAIDV